MEQRAIAIGRWAREHTQTGATAMHGNAHAAIQQKVHMTHIILHAISSSQFNTAKHSKSTGGQHMR